VVLIVGHRGNPARYPDNSLAGLLSARDVADMAEIDVRRTADGAAVLSHDPHVGNATLVEQDLRTVLSLERDGHPVVQFVDLLDEIGEFPLNIEIKNHDHEPDYDPTHRFAIEVAGRARPGDLVTCFDWPTIGSIHAALPEVRTGLLVDVGHSFEEAVDSARAGGQVAIAVHWSAMASQPELKVAEAIGLDIFVWTVNDPMIALVVAEAGATGIITDDPAAIRAAIQEQS